jgi:hypothetical protein
MGCHPIKPACAGTFPEIVAPLSGRLAPNSLDVSGLFVENRSPGT